MDATLFHPPRVSWMMLAVANGIVLIVFGVIWIFFANKNAPGTPWTLAIPAGGLAGALWRLLRRPARAILVSPRTIRILGRCLEQEVYRVSDIGRARWSFTTGTVVIERPDGTELTRISPRFLGSTFTMLRVARAIKKVQSD